MFVEILWYDKKFKYCSVSFSFRFVFSSALVGRKVDASQYWDREKTESEMGVRCP